jgi:hypothetical protein
MHNVRHGLDIASFLAEPVKEDMEVHLVNLRFAFVVVPRQFYNHLNARTTKISCLCPHATYGVNQCVCNAGKKGTQRGHGSSPRESQVCLRQVCLRRGSPTFALSFQCGDPAGSTKITCLCPHAPYGATLCVCNAVRGNYTCVFLVLNSGQLEGAGVKKVHLCCPYFPFRAI